MSTHTVVITDTQAYYYIDVCMGWDGMGWGGMGWGGVGWDGVGWGM